MAGWGENARSEEIMAVACDGKADSGAGQKLRPSGAADDNFVPPSAPSAVEQNGVQGLKQARPQTIILFLFKLLAMSQK